MKMYFQFTSIELYLKSHIPGNKLARNFLEFCPTWPGKAELISLRKLSKKIKKGLEKKYQ